VRKETHCVSLNLFIQPIERTVRDGCNLLTSITIISILEDLYKSLRIVSYGLLKGFLKKTS
jgi:hypothetical protein